MCEVTRKNFNEKYPQIIDDLHAASFISIDCEFSGLFNDNFRNSLFDTPCERYEKLRQTLQPYAILQLGLSTFQYDRKSNKFLTTSYSFYLIPSDFFKNKSNFTCQMTSLNFLCKHNFNFNTLFNDGITYLNKVDEAEIVRMMQEDEFEYNDQQELQKYCSQVAAWNETAVEGSEVILDIEGKSTLVYAVHQDIRKKFLNLWTYDCYGGIKVKKLSNSAYREVVSTKEELNIKKRLIDELIGFSKIMKEIQNLKKPLVGHNFLLDLMMIYKHFFYPLPTSYKQFKDKISKFFPLIYDTKVLSYRLKEIQSKGDTWQSNSLCELYRYFKDGKGATLVLFTPATVHKQEDFVESEAFHNAGFDSYCTGFCFIKMAHIFSLWDEGKKSFIITSLPTTSSWLMGAVAPMKNYLNISRGQVNHIVLDGPDPKCTRPALLYIESKHNSLNVGKISQIIVKYGSVDIKLINKRSGLVAVTNHRQLKEILQCFKNHNEYSVSEYSFLKHSNLGRTILTIFAITSLIGIFSSKSWRTNK